MTVQEVIDFLSKIDDKSVKCYAYRSHGDYDGPSMEELETINHRYSYSITRGDLSPVKIGVYFNET